MSQSRHSLSSHYVPALLPGLGLLLAISVTPARADSLHAVWHDEDRSALVDHMLTTLAEDLRSNRLFLTTSPEQLRSFLLQRLCLGPGAGCADNPAAVARTNLALAPADIELLLQHLNASLQARRMPLQQQQRLLLQFTGQTREASTQGPLASL